MYAERGELYAGTLSEVMISLYRVLAVSQSFSMMMGGVHYGAVANAFQIFLRCCF